MKKQNNISKSAALIQLMKECSRSEKSPFDIEKKLKSWGLEQHADDIIEKLRMEKFLDEKRFTKAFIHDKIWINKWGRIKIRFLLLQHKIPLKSYKQLVWNELAKKKLSLKNMKPLQVKSKLFSFGYQRGYETDQIREFYETSEEFKNPWDVQVTRIDQVLIDSRFTNSHTHAVNRKHVCGENPLT